MSFQSIILFTFQKQYVILQILNNISENLSGYGGRRVDPVVIGVDLGGTNLRAAILDSDGRILHKSKEATYASEGRVKVVSRLIEVIKKHKAHARELGRDVAVVGVGAPGVIYMDKGIVVKSPNFPDWNNLPLKDELEAESRKRKAESRRTSGSGFSFFALCFPLFVQDAAAMATEG